MKARHALLVLLLAAPAAAKEKKAAPAAPETPAPAVSSATTATPEMEAAVRRLLKITDAHETGKKVSQAYMDQMSPMMASLVGEDQERLDALLADMKAQFDKHFTDEAVTRITVDCYAKYMTLEDVRALAVFYETPAGRRIVKSNPQVMQESVTRSVEMAQAVMPEILRAMAAKYPEARALLPQERDPAAADDKPEEKPAETTP